MDTNKKEAMTTTDKIMFALACNEGEAMIIKDTIDSYDLLNWQVCTDAEMKVAIGQSLEIVRGL